MEFQIEKDLISIHCLNRKNTDEAREKRGEFCENFDTLKKKKKLKIKMEIKIEINRHFIK